MHDKFVGERDCLVQGHGFYIYGSGPSVNQSSPLCKDDVFVLGWAVGFDLPARATDAVVPASPVRLYENVGSFVYDMLYVFNHICVVWLVVVEDDAAFFVCPCVVFPVCP